MKKIIITLIISLLMTVIFVGCGSQESQKTTGKGNEDEEIIQTLNDIEAFGKVIAPNTMNIIPEFQATVESILVREGQKVEKGTVLIEFDSSIMENQIKSKEYELEMENMRLEQIKKNQTHSGYTRSQRDIDINMQEEKIEWIEGEIELLNEQLSKSYLNNNAIISPFNTAVVCDITSTVGDTIGSGIKALSLMDLDNLIVEADIPEEFVKDVNIGADVTIKPVADSQREYSGKVNRIGKMAVNRNGQTLVIVEISIQNADDFLIPHYNVNVFINRD